MVPRRAFIFRAVANKQIDGFLTAKQIADLHFFSKKQFRGEENVDVKARQIIRKLLSLFNLIDTLGLDCQNALEIENGDYEDAVLVKSAIRSGIDCIVTRNADHFKDISLQVYSPKQFISIITRLDQGN